MVITMPNMSAHMAIAKRVSDALKINSDDFYKGNLLPDLYKDKIKSHYKIQGKIYLIPDINKVINSLDFNSKKNLGILCHLLLDKYFFDEYLPSIFDKDIFNSDDSKVIYKDYDILNKDIVEYFNLDVDYITKTLSNFEEDIEQDKLELNISCLRKVENGTTYYLDKDDFIKFLDEVSNKILGEVKKIM